MADPKIAAEIHDAIHSPDDVGPGSCMHCQSAARVCERLISEAIDQERRRYAALVEAARHFLRDGLVGTNTVWTEIRDALDALDQDGES